MADLPLLKVRRKSLTKKQLETIELAVGVPWSRLDERASDMVLAAAIRSVIEGQPLDAYDDVPGMALIESVEIEDEDDGPGND